MSQFVTGLGKGVLCSRELSVVGRTMAANFKWRWANTGGLGIGEGQVEEIRFWPGALEASKPLGRSPLLQGFKPLHEQISAATADAPADSSLGVKG